MTSQTMISLLAFSIALIQVVAARPKFPFQNPSFICLQTTRAISFHNLAVTDDTLIEKFPEDCQTRFKPGALEKQFRRMIANLGTEIPIIMKLRSIAYKWQRRNEKVKNNFPARSIQRTQAQMCRFVNGLFPDVSIDDCKKNPEKTLKRKNIETEVTAANERVICARVSKRLLKRLLKRVRDILGKSDSTVASTESPTKVGTTESQGGNSGNSSTSGTTSGTSCDGIRQMQSVKRILDAHNEFRGKFNGNSYQAKNVIFPEATNAISKLVWNENLSRLAQQHSEACVLNHSTNRKDRFGFSSIGENIFQTKIDGENCDCSRKKPDWSVAVASWFNEIDFYTNQTSACDEVDSFTKTTINGNSVAHFTQVIWENTTDVGCGISACSGCSFIVTCNYGESGNILNRPIYSANQCEASG